MKCKIEKFTDESNFPHRIFDLIKDEALLLQNFLNSVAIESKIDCVDYSWDKSHNMWVSDEECQYLLDNAELLGIEFIVEGS